MKQVPTKNPGDQYSSNEFNTLPSYELQNSVTDTDIILNELDTHQLSKTISNYVNSGNYYSDSGSANNYVLSALGNLQPPTQYRNGMQIRFLAANTNTGSSQVNLASIGIKEIKDRYGQNLSAGMIVAGYQYVLRYNGTNFILDSLLQPTIFSGLIVSNNAITPNTHVDISTGICTDKNNVFKMVNYSTFVKRLDQTWIAGTNNGGRASAVSYAANTWYHLFIIAKVDGTVDFGFDDDIDAANLLSDATGYIYYKRLTTVRTDGSSFIRKFVNINNTKGRLILWQEPFIHLNTAFVQLTEYKWAVVTPPVGQKLIAIERSYLSWNTVPTSGNTATFLFWLYPVGFTKGLLSHLMHYSNYVSYPSFTRDLKDLEILVDENREIAGYGSYEVGPNGSQPFIDLQTMGWYEID